MGKLLFISFIFHIFCFPVCCTAAEEQDFTPLEVIKKSNGEAILVQQNPMDVAARQKELYLIMDRVTDWPLLAGAATSKACSNTTPESCRKLQAVFTEILRLSAARKLGRYQANSFSYIGEEISGDSATVKTIAFYGDEQIALDYELKKNKGLWKIVNYSADGTDTVRNYQRQFNRILRKKSFNELITQLQRQVERMRNNR